MDINLILDYMIQNAMLPAGITIINKSNTYNDLVIEGAVKPTEQEFIDTWAIIEPSINVENQAKADLIIIESAKSIYYEYMPYIRQWSEDLEQTIQDASTNNWTVSQTVNNLYAKNRTNINLWTVNQKKFASNYVATFNFDTTEPEPITDEYRGSFNHNFGLFLQHVYNRIK